MGVAGSGKSTVGASPKISAFRSGKRSFEFSQTQFPLFG
jgi:gluconate kinase